MNINNIKEQDIEITKFAGTDVTWEGDKYLILEEKDILAIV